MLKKSILDTYNHPVPRYTSYPPATFFKDGFSATDCLIAFKESNQHEPANLSFYIHIPFCRHHCTYCGCNAYPMSNASGIETYMQALHQEMELVLPNIDFSRKISQIHFGGGSPTSIPVHYLKKIIDLLTARFQRAEQCEIAIECHPGYLSLADWDELADAGFNRCSIGVQDFDTNVLEAVNRKPSKEDLSVVVSQLHAKGISVNLDFIYGLPLQTAEGFASSIRQAVALRPERLVTFSYAHVPWVHPIQKALEKKGLPSSELKTQLYEAAVSILKEAGYRRIGMDHFVLPGDELDQAADSSKLHRNFQGYCTWETTGQVYAFGVTAISQLSALYAQNTKSIADYIRLLKEGCLPVVKGYRLTAQQQVVREVIADLMCNGKINWNALALRLKIGSAEVLKQNVAYPADALEKMANDGIIHLTAHEIRMTEMGGRFVRNVAALFDPLYIPGSTGYSLPI